MSNSLSRRLFRRFRRTPVVPAVPVDYALQKAQGRRDSFAGQIMNALTDVLGAYLDLEWSEDFTHYGIDYMEVPLRHIYVGDKQRSIREIVDLRVEVVQENDAWITRVRLCTLMWDSNPGPSFCDSYRIIPVKTKDEVAAIARAVGTHLRGKRDPIVLTTEAVAEIVRFLPKHDSYYRDLLDRPGYTFELPKELVA